MLAKGHDFPQLTLVVVVDADGALFSSDFRAGERLFALLLQVAGRAGRAAKPGEVLIQTRFPGHPLFGAVIAQKFAAFADTELALRRAAELPPFSYQALLRADAPDERAVDRFVHGAAQQARELAQGGVRVFDAVPASVARVAGRNRWQLLIQAPRRDPLQRFVAAWKPVLATLTGRVRWSIDIDPLEIC
jgi:primosomal protein N' (replication factor Y)